MKKKIFPLVLSWFLLLIFVGGCDGTEASPSTETLITFGDSVQIDGSGVTVDENAITIGQGGVYTIQGTLANGQIIVDTPQPVTLRLNGAHISNAQGAAIVFKRSEHAQIELAEGSSNSLADGGESEYDAALYSAVSLTLSGEGQLSVTGHYQEGIASDENITIESGTYIIASTDDGLNASHDGESVITINGGTLLIDSGGDGIDSNGSLVINGGTIVTMSALSDMSGGIDTDGDFVLNGGTVLATGAMNTLPSDQSTQPVVSFDFKKTQTAATPLQIMENEQPLLTAIPAKAYQTLLYSSADLSSDSLYTVYVGGVSQTTEAILADETPDSAEAAERPSLTVTAITDVLPAQDVALTDSIQQTHRDAATAGEFATSGLLTRFRSVTYLTDTDFTNDFEPRHPDGTQPPQHPGGDRPPRPDGNKQNADKNSPPPDSQAPAAPPDEKP